MEMTIRTDANKSTIWLAGRFDFNAHQEFREATDKALAQAGATIIEVDMGAVSYLDSSALGMLLMLRDKTRAAGKTVHLANTRGSVRQVLEIANFGKLFPLV